MQIIEIVLSPLLALLIGIFFLGLSRKIMARIHWRYGPPITQPVIDVIRLFSQKPVSHGRIFNLGVVLSLAGSFVVLLFLPMGGIHPLSGSGGMLVILYMMLLAPLGIALSGGEAANPNVSIGISRKLLLALGYEIPLLLVLLAVMTYYRTISIVEIVGMQQTTQWAFFSLPLLLSGIAYLLILPAILGIRPFEIVQAPQEISSGPMAEYGGPFLALATIQHALALYIGRALPLHLERGTTVLQLAVGTAIVVIVTSIPLLGWMAWVAALLLTFGAVLRSRFGSQPPPVLPTTLPPAAPPPAAPA